MQRLPIRPTIALLIGVGIVLAVAPVGINSVGLGQFIDHAVAERSAHGHTVVKRLPPAILPAGPVQAVLLRDNSAVPSGAWVSAHHAMLRITVRASPASAGSLGADVEIEPLARPFTGHTTASSPLVHVAAGRTARIIIPLPRLADGQQYHWQVRVRNAQKLASRWATGGRFGMSNRPPAAPSLSMTTVQLGGWSSPRQVIFRWHEQTALVPVRSFLYAIVPAGHSVEPVSTSWHRLGGPQLSLPSLTDGRWQLLVRAVNAAGALSRTSVWPFGLARGTPPAPRLVSAQPLPGSWGAIATPTLRWQGVKGAAPLRAYEYQVVRTDEPAGAAPTWRLISKPVLSLPSLADGAWRVQVRDLDKAGNVSPPLTWTFHLDRLPPALTVPASDVNTFTPPAQQLRVQFNLRQEELVTYEIYAAGQARPLHSATLGWIAPGSGHVIQWDGRLDAGRLAPAGAYTMVIRGADRTGASTVVSSQPVTVQDKWIRVSLSKEELWAYQGNTLIAQSPVTTGGPWLPTPTGTFHVLAKYTGYVFRSPWPLGSPYWYADSPTNFALLYESDGYFIHDAPWRSVYGPGSNSVAGTPGGNYTGTHGCTNVPYNEMVTLFNWASVGTLVQIVP